MQTKTFWDEKALSFPRYDCKNDSFQQSLMTLLQNKGILNSTSTVLDIGAGTGIYTLPLAQKAKQVVAIDISTNMLTQLKEDAWYYNLNNVIHTHNSSWQSFKSDKRFDILFASLSAAFNSTKDYEKLLEYTKKHVVILDFVGTKGSNFEKLLEINYGIQPIVYDDIKNLKIWLNSKSITYTTTNLFNQYTQQIDINRAIKKVNETLHHHKITLTKEEILHMLKPLTLNNNVQHTMHMNLELIIWQKD